MQHIRANSPVGVAALCLDTDNAAISGSYIKEHNQVIWLKHFFKKIELIGFSIGKK